MPPPPTPASLADLPGQWLLKLAGSDSFKRQNTTLWSLSRSCSLFRDLVLRQRKATATFKVPIAAEDFPRELRRLCTLVRSSRNIRLGFNHYQGQVPWTETEPHIAHLLLCAMAQLGGQPLMAVKEIGFQFMGQTSLVPMWLPLTCPNVISLECSGGIITDHLPLPAPPPPRSATTASPAPAPVACQHLQHLEVPQMERLGAQHLRQQLAALPSLSNLTMWDMEDLSPELHSTSLTRLRVDYGSDETSAAGLPHLPAQFPNLAELDASYCLSVDDAGLEALLSMRSLLRVTVRHLKLRRSHARRPCAWEQLTLRSLYLDVDELARLPLEGIQRITVGGNEVYPSRDAETVARVVAAIKRSGGLGLGVFVSYGDATALLTTLRPLLEAVPAEEQREITIDALHEATPEVVRQLGQQLTPAVRTLHVAKFSLAQEAWATVLPSLPATMMRLQLGFGWPAPPQVEEHVLALCSAAVRPIMVLVWPLQAEAKQRILALLAQQGNTHVTLEAQSW